jgi:hypothetical protein
MSVACPPSTPAARRLSDNVEAHGPHGAAANPNEKRNPTQRRRTAHVGFLNAHHIDDGKAANEVDADVPACQLSGRTAASHLGT